MFGRWALVLTLLVFGMSLDVQAAPRAVRAQAKVSKSGHRLTVKKVRRKDGSVVVRLDMPASTSSAGLADAAANPAISDMPRAGDAGQAQANVLAKNSHIMNQWLDAVTEPRFMTALAAVAMEPGAEAKALNQGIDPAKVRNWAEFVDPDLYLRWKAGMLDPRFNRAILKSLPELQAAPFWIALPANLEVPMEARAGIPLKPSIWSNVLNGGPGGQEAAREWLKLPMPDPRLNPWLGPIRNYRY